MTDEKRKFSRIIFNVPARLSVGEHDYEVERIVNLSIGGCLLEIAGDFSVGEPCRFVILLEGQLPGVEVFGSVVRSGHGEVSLEFRRIEPEHLFHLQNIVRYNAGNPDVIEEEIDAHPGLK